MIDLESAMSVLEVLIRIVFNTTLVYVSNHLDILQ